jgi:hypothetical protein
MKLTEHVTLNFNNNMSTAAVFLNVGKAFETTWNVGLLYILSQLKFSISLIKPISSFLSQRKFRVSVEGEISTQRYIEAGTPQVYVMSPALYNLYINDTPQTPGAYLDLFADGGPQKGYVLRKLQRSFGAIETWCGWCER